MPRGTVRQRPPSNVEACLAEFRREASSVPPLHLAVAVSDALDSIRFWTLRIYLHINPLTKPICDFLGTEMDRSDVPSGALQRSKWAAPMFHGVIGRG